MVLTAGGRAPGAAGWQQQITSLRQLSITNLVGQKRRLEDETVWLTQAQMAELFQTSKQNVSLHTNNIFKEKELRPSEARNSASGRTKC